MLPLRLFADDNRPLIRRSWRCRRCGRTFFLITGFRGRLNPPMCNHRGTVKFGRVKDYPMYRTRRPGRSR